MLMTSARAASVSIRGAVTDNAGNALLGHVSIFVEDSQGLTENNLTTDEAGRYSVTVDGSHTVLVYVRAAYHTDVEHAIPANSLGPVSLRSVLHPWQTVSGRVTGPFGQGIEGATVKVRADGPRRRVKLHHEEVRTDANGNFIHPRAPVGKAFHWQVYFGAYLAAVSDSTYVSQGREAVPDIVVSSAAIAADDAGASQAPDLAPQFGDYNNYSRCELETWAYNSNREIGEDGAVNAECGAPYDRWYHTMPFGNWGVISPWSEINDTDQFRGWKHEDGPSTKRQWNSCTTFKKKTKTSTGKYDYYTHPYDDRQRNTHTNKQVRFGALTVDVPSSVQECGEILYEQPVGCSVLSGRKWRVTKPYMKLYELDKELGWDGNDYVTELRYSSKTVNYSGCTRSGCSTINRSWSAPNWLEVPDTKISASLKLRTYVNHVNTCPVD